MPLAELNSVENCDQFDENEKNVSTPKRVKGKLM